MKNDLNNIMALINKATLAGAYNIQEVDLAIKSINNLDKALNEQLPKSEPEKGTLTKK